VRRYIPAIALFFFWVSLQVSNVHSDALAILLLVFAAVLLLIGIWPQVRRLQHGEDLRVTLLRDEWDNFQLWGHILQMKVRIENRTGRAKRCPSHTLQFEGVTPAPIADEPGAAELRNEVEARKDRLQQMKTSVIDPHDSVSGWLFFTFGGLDPEQSSFKLFMVDEMGRNYEARK
jgi:hypothetical protein